MFAAGVSDFGRVIHEPNDNDASCAPRKHQHLERPREANGERAPLHELHALYPGKRARLRSRTRWWGVPMMVMTVATAPSLARWQSRQLEAQTSPRVSSPRVADAHMHIRLTPAQSPDRPTWTWACRSYWLPVLRWCRSSRMQRPNRQ